MVRNGNSNLHDSSRNKQDEFYTNLQLIEGELKHYRHHFKGKRVLCNCDDPYESNFFKYFAMSFNSLGLKSLTATCYAASPFAQLELDLFGGGEKTGLHGTYNPVNPVNPVKKRGGKPPYKIVITEVKDETDFKIDENGQKWRRMGNICWFTNLDFPKRHEEMTLFRHYTSEAYPKYDNYDAIEVAKTDDIPKDWDGVIGVPITFIYKHVPDQFEIIGATESEGKGFSNGLWNEQSGVAQPLIGGKRIYKRIFIRRRK